METKQKRFNLIHVTLSATLLFLAACSNNSSSSSSNGDQTTSTSSSQSLIGSWLGCEASQNYSTLIETQFTATNFTLVLTTYASTNCTGTASAQVQSTGTYTLGAPSTSVSGATNLTLNESSNVQLEAFTVAQATVYNNNSFCGISNWAAGAPRIVANTNSCISSITAFNGSFIYEITNNTLYVDSSTATSIDTSGGGLTKQ